VGSAEFGEKESSGKFLLIRSCYRDALWAMAAAHPARPPLLPNEGFLEKGVVGAEESEHDAGLALDEDEEDEEDEEDDDGDGGGGGGASPVGAVAFAPFVSPALGSVPFVRVAFVRVRSFSTASVASSHTRAMNASPASNTPSTTRSRSSAASAPHAPFQLSNTSASLVSSAATVHEGGRRRRAAVAARA
jgi:hypothetical protein